MRADDGECRVLVLGLDGCADGAWELMEVMWEKAMVRSEAWVVLGRVTLEMCTVSGEGGA